MDNIWSFIVHLMGIDAPSLRYEFLVKIYHIVNNIQEATYYTIIVASRDRPPHWYHGSDRCFPVTSDAINQYVCMYANRGLTTREPYQFRVAYPRDFQVAETRLLANHLGEMYERQLSYREESYIAAPPIEDITPQQATSLPRDRERFEEQMRYLESQRQRMSVLGNYLLGDLQVENNFTETPEKIQKRKTPPHKNKPCLIR